LNCRSQIIEIVDLVHTVVLLDLQLPSSGQSISSAHVSKLSADEFVASGSPLVKSKCKRLFPLKAGILDLQPIAGGSPAHIGALLVLGDNALKPPLCRQAEEFLAVLFDVVHILERFGASS
jgi:hypothetical protein